jgi:diketogulonate reductase-like aldo/keto reductase
MHCETTVDPEATWRESWRALEKAYAEGRVTSIGVSNFDATLLDEITNFATVLPHVVQNWAEVGKVDSDVRHWCREYRAIYQPYAANRNLHLLSAEVSSVLGRIAGEHSRSTHSVSSRFFLQTGAAIIPRSSQEAHLKENIDVFGFNLTDEQMEELGWGEDDREDL